MQMCMEMLSIVMCCTYTHLQLDAAYYIGKTTGIARPKLVRPMKLGFRVGLLHAP